MIIVNLIVVFNQFRSETKTWNHFYLNIISEYVYVVKEMLTSLKNINHLIYVYLYKHLQRRASFYPWLTVFLLMNSAVDRILSFHKQCLVAQYKIWNWIQLCFLFSFGFSTSTVSVSRRQVSRRHFGLTYHPH